MMINNSVRRTQQALHSNQNYHTTQDKQQIIIKRSSSLGNIINNSLTISNIHSKINEYGRCINHPNIELVCCDNNNNTVRILQDCPLCSSLDMNNSNSNNNDGLLSTLIISSSNKTTIDNRTISTEESTITTEESGSRIRPPPPPRLSQSVGNMNTQAQQQHANRRQNSYPQQQQQMRQQQNNQVQSLKELGRKLVMESDGFIAVVGILNHYLLTVISDGHNSNSNSNHHLHLDLQDSIVHHHQDGVDLERMIQ